MKESKAIQKIIQKNSDISPEIRDLVAEIYGDIYTYMDRYNFARWLSFQNISDIAKNIVYNVCQESEDSNLDKKTMGYFSFFIDDQSRIRRKVVLKRENSKEKRIGAHETYHSLADGLGGYPPFFGEGITEFLAKGTYNALNKYYMRNVNVIYELIRMYGHTPIRDYFLVQGGSFFQNINKEIVDGEVTSQKFDELTTKTNEMLETFSKYQQLISAKDPDADENENEQEEIDLIIRGRELLVEQYLEKVKASVDRLDYYDNGSINFERFNNDLISALLADFDDSYIFAKQEEMTDYLIEHSHLLVGLDGEVREKTKNELYGLISEQFFEGYDGGRMHRISPNRVLLNGITLKDLNQDTEEKVISFAFKRENFGDKKRFNYRRYFRVLNNFVDNVCQKREDAGKYLEEISVNLSDFPEEFKAFCERVINTYREVNLLAHKSYMKDESVKVSSTKISAIGPSKAYIIKRDREKSIITVDSTTGELVDIPLSSVRYKSKGMWIEEIHEYDLGMSDLPRFVGRELMARNRVFKVLNNNTKKTSYISLSEDNNGRVLNGLVENRIDSSIGGFEELKELIIQDNLLQELQNRIHGGVYSSRLKDAEHKGERVSIDYKKFVEDYLKLKAFLPVDRTRFDFRLLVDELLDYSFGLRLDEKTINDPDRDTDKFLSTYDDLKSSIVNSMLNLSRLLENDGDPKWHRIRRNAHIHINSDLEKMNNLISLCPEEKAAMRRLSPQTSDSVVDGIVGLSKAKTKASDFKKFFGEVEEKIVSEEER